MPFEESPWPAADNATRDAAWDKQWKAEHGGDTQWDAISQSWVPAKPAAAAPQTPAATPPTAAAPPPSSAPPSSAPRTAAIDFATEPDKSAAVFADNSNWKPAFDPNNRKDSFDRNASIFQGSKTVAPAATPPPLPTPAPGGGLSSYGGASTQDAAVGPSAPPAQLTDVFRQIQNPDDQGGTNTALAINAWCLLDGGGGGQPIITRTYAAFMRFAFPSKLIRVGLYAHPAGSLTVDILRGTLSSFGTWATIVGAVTPSFSATDHVEITADQLTDWDVLNSRADLLRIDVTVAATCEIALLDLWAVRTDATDKTTQ
jgi:hypothetical protein